MLTSLLSYQITRDHCAATIYQGRAYKYNLTKIDASRPGLDSFTGKTKAGDIFTIYFSMCDPITQDQLPDEVVATGADLTDTFAVKCLNKTEGLKCEPLLYVSDFDWKQMETAEKGVIYYALGQPLLYDTNTYHTFDITMKFINDGVGVIDTFVYEYEEDSTGNQFSITATMHTDKVDIEEVSIPSPTPKFRPDCEYKKRSSTDPNKGYQVDLSMNNGGPFGVRKVIKINGQQQILFYQPCERMECPIGYECQGTDVYSSAWLCTDPTTTGNKGQCKSYGVQQEVIDVDLTSESPATAQVTMYESSEQLSSQLTLTCESSYPMNHFIFNEDATIDGNVLKIAAKSSDLCIRNFNPPDPLPGSKCSTIISDETTGEFVSLNVARFNNLTTKAGTTVHAGHKITGLTLENKPIGVTMKDPYILYEPCGGIFCPAASGDCEGDEDSFVWLCYTDSDEKEVCKSYGLWENEIELTPKSYGKLSEGITARYEGSRSRNYYSKIHWHCKSTQAYQTVSFGDTLTWQISGSNTYLHLDAYAHEVCVNAGESWHPVVKTPGPTPTPTPLPWVCPTGVYYEGDTYLIAQLSRLNQDVFEDRMRLGSTQPNVNFSSWKVIYHPWKSQPCPEGYSCDGHEEANIWGCWTKEDSTKFCHAVADKNYGIDITPIDKTNLSQGLRINMDGVYGSKAQIRCACNPNSVDDKNTITFDGDTYSRWGPTMNGDQYYFFTDSQYCCPRTFYSPTPFPAPSTKTPKPDPYSGPTYYHTDEDLETGLAHSIDLADFDMTVDQAIVTGYADHFDKARLVMNPYRKISPPSDYVSLGDDKSNVWKCQQFSQGQYCVPIGDMDVNLEFSTHSDSGHKDGIAVEYGTGYAGYNSVFIYLCNSTVGDKVWIDPLIEKWGGSKTYIFRAHSALACLRPIQHRTSTGGAYFLLIVFLAFILYFSIGVIYQFIRHGVVEIPNAAFWYEFCESVEYVVAFIATCGKGAPTVGSSSYDAI